MNIDKNSLNEMEVQKGFRGFQVNRRYFWWPFRRRKKLKYGIRPGAMLPEVVHQKIRNIGVGKQVEIIRIGFDGEIDDMPIMIELIDVDETGFTGKIMNVERHLIESATDKLVYAKKGGGIITFNFNDGDIKDIIEIKDKQYLEEERNIGAIKEILAALEKDDKVIVAYYDSKEKGTLNAEGILLEKNLDQNKFSIQIEKINRIELERKIKRDFDIEKDIVIDLDMV
jgi:hypothetical protein